MSAAATKRVALVSGPRKTEDQKSPPNTSAEASQGIRENPSNLKMFEREDWTLFRTVEGLQQKAGFVAALLRRLCLKELGDNGLDTNTATRAGHLGEERFFVEDDGPGLDGTPEEIAELFSIRRPMRSSKLLRRPQRGALGNGLRVVAGIVFADVDYPLGTNVEIGFGPALPYDPNALSWVNTAIAFAGGNYAGASSAYWYDAAQFHELVLACGAQPVRSLIAQLDGCSGGKAGDVVAAAGLGRTACQAISRAQATELLKLARAQARPVSSDRLGAIGRDAFPDGSYAIKRGSVPMGGSKPQAEIPFVVEAWAVKRATKGNEIGITVCINRTPSSGEVEIYRDEDKDFMVFGSGLGDCCAGPKKGSYVIAVNVTTPYCPITSDGKAPDLGPFTNAIMDVIGAATRKAQRAAPREDKKLSQKSLIYDNLPNVVADVSGDGQYRFAPRQLFYQLRPVVKEAIGEELNITNFSAILTDYENEHGEISVMYRDPRGFIYHPHRKEEIPLGTLNVEQYERPPWTFNKMLYVEKEGFHEALKADRWPERNDCGLMSSKGFTTRAARDLVDKLAEHDEPVTIFCVHDADASGTLIYQTFQEETKARGARKIKIVNLGLEPWEAVENFEVEDIPEGKKRRPVAKYVLEREDGEEWGAWLQTHRVELNAMTTPEFITWLDGKMSAYGVGKLVPPQEVVGAELEKQLEVETRAVLTARILREAKVEEQIVKALAKIKRPAGNALVRGRQGLTQARRRARVAQPHPSRGGEADEENLNE